jgi:myo-inositol-1(or 4)-monophosphatase
MLTKYDIEINDKILKHLESYYPEISVISEESDDILKASEYAFVIDPIDGTRNFVRNIPVFYIGIGLIKNNETLLCVTYNPITEELFWAIKGQGAFKNNTRLKVSDRIIGLSDLQIRTVPDKKLEKEIVNKVVENVFAVKNEMCSHHEISGVACARYDGLISRNSKSWDYCHYLLVEEAGGKVTDWKGEKFDLSKDNIIVSNGIIHNDLLKVTV